MPLDTPLLDNNNSTNSASSVVIEGEKPLNFVQRFGFESKKLWKIAGPAIITALCQYSLGALTLTFAGQVGELDLAAVSVENSCVAGFAFGVMVVKLNFFIFIFWLDCYYSIVFNYITNE